MSFVTVDFPDIRESDSAEYAYLANVYNTTYSHNQNACVRLMKTGLTEPRMPRGG